MKTKDNYDWIVLGDSPGALLSAALAARLGLSVLVLPLGSESATRTSETGQVLDCEPNWILGSDPKTSAPALLNRCFAALDAKPEDYQTRLSEVPEFQVATPEHRVVLSRVPEQLRTALRFEFQKEGEGTEKKSRGGKAQSALSEWVDACHEARMANQAYWAALPDRLTISLEKKKESRLPAWAEGLKAKNIYHSNQAPPPKRIPDLGALERRLGQLGRASKYGVMGIESRVAPSGRALLGSVALTGSGTQFRGGRQELRKVLKSLAERHGAHVPSGTSCKRLFIADGRFVGIQVSSRGTLVSCSAGILGCELDRVQELATSERRKWFKKFKVAPAPSHWNFTLALTVHREAIPPGMKSRLIWQENDAPALELEIADTAEYGVDEPEHAFLFLRTPLPYKPESLQVDYQKLVASRMLRQAIGLIPFLEFHIVRVYPDFRSKDGEFSEAYGFASETMIPDYLRAYSGHGMGSQTGIDGLFTASKEAYPEQGLLGQFVAALEATAWIAHRSGLAGPLP